MASVLFILGAVALYDRLATPTASATVHVARDWGDVWEDRLETGVPGVIFIPPDIPPPPPGVVAFIQHYFGEPPSWWVFWVLPEPALHPPYRHLDHLMDYGFSSPGRHPKHD